MTTHGIMLKGLKNELEEGIPKDRKIWTPIKIKTAKNLNTSNIYKFTCLYKYFQKTHQSPLEDARFSNHFF